MRAWTLLSLPVVAILVALACSTCARAECATAEQRLMRAALADSAKTSCAAHPPAASFRVEMDQTDRSSDTTWRYTVPLVTDGGAWSMRTIRSVGLWVENPELFDAGSLSFRPFWKKEKLDDVPGFVDRRRGSTYGATVKVQW